MSSETIMINKNVKQKIKAENPKQSRRRQIKRSVIQKGFFSYELLIEEHKKIFDKIVMNRLKFKNDIKKKKEEKKRKRAIIMEAMYEKNDYKPFAVIGW